MLGLTAMGWALSGSVLEAQPSRVEVFGFVTPESVAVGPDGNYYVSVIQRFGTAGDGSIQVIKGDPFLRENTKEILVEGLDDPKGMIFIGDTLYVTDITKVLAIDLEGNVEVFAEGEDFPDGVEFLNDIDADPDGNLYVTDTNLLLVNKIDPEGNVTVFASLTGVMSGPNGVLFDAEGHIGEPGSVLVIDLRGQRKIVVISPDGSEITELVSGAFFQGDGLAFDQDGTLYASDVGAGGIYTVDANGNVEAFDSRLQSPADFMINPENNWMVVASFGGNKVTFIRL
jgi:hypothetical protein